MDDFEHVSFIGRGSFGKVNLVIKKDTGELLALKSVYKNKLSKSHKYSNIMSERNIMACCHNQFIASLKYAFQDERKCYLALEYAAGGELYNLLKKVGHLTWDQCKLYIAEIAIALDYIHSIGVIYRDLKLENIVLDEEGHVKLTDFGLSKMIKDKGNTNSICGTELYLSPEMVSKSDYGFEIDWWSLGIITYEVLFGSHPFYCENMTKYYNNIINKDPVFPFETSPVVEDLVLSLLQKRPDKRANFKTLMKHPAWGSMKYEDVLNRKFKPYFVPNIKDFKDPVNFDTERSQEEGDDSASTPPMSLNSECKYISDFSFCESQDDQTRTPVPPSSILVSDS